MQGIINNERRRNNYSANGRCGMKLWETFKQWSLKKKVIVILVIVFLLSFTQFIFPSNRRGLFGTGLPSPMESFVGNNVHLSIDYPSSWVASELPQGSHGDKEVFALIINPGNWMPSVWFARHDFQNNDLNQVAEWGESRILSQRSMYESISLTRIHTSSIDGLIRQYTWESESPLGKTRVRCEDLYIFENGTGYALSFCTEEKDWDDTEAYFQKMIESFDLR